MSQPAVAESLRPIQVFSYPPTPTRALPQLPAALIGMFLRELSNEPHHNDFFCDQCGRPYSIAAQEGKSCTRPQEGGVICHGTVIRRWTKEKAQVELQRLMTQGGVAIARELGEPFVPVGLAVCEAHRSGSVVKAIDFPMSVLSDVYGKLGREEPFLVLSHLWIEHVAQSQKVELIRQLVTYVVESVSRTNGLSVANVLVPMSSRDSELRYAVLGTMLTGKKQILLRDQRSNRHRALRGFQLELRND